LTSRDIIRQVEIRPVTSGYRCVVEFLTAPRLMVHNSRCQGLCPGGGGGI
jgi:hypothetical protein